MSVKSVGATSLTHSISPNSSLILDQIDDEDENMMTRARHASYGFFNRKFTRNKLRSVFPAGFTTERVRTDKDLLEPGVVKINGKTKKTVNLKLSTQMGAQALPRSSTSLSLNRTKKSFTDVFRGGEVGFPDDMTDSSVHYDASNSMQKGDDFADVAGPYYQELPAGGRQRQEPLIKIPFTREAQRAQAQPQLNQQVQQMPFPDAPGGITALLEQYSATGTQYAAVRGAELEAGSLTSSLHDVPPPTQNKDLVTNVVQMYNRGHWTPEERTLHAQTKAKVKPLASVAPFIPPSKLPPMPKKAVPIDTAMLEEEASIASIAEMVAKSGLARSRPGSTHPSQIMTRGASSQPLEMNDSMSLANPSTFDGARIMDEDASSPDFVAQLDGYVNSPTNSPDSWPRRGQYTAPPRERKVKRTPSPKRKAMTVSVPGKRQSTTKKRQGKSKPEEVFPDSPQPSEDSPIDVGAEGHGSSSALPPHTVMQAHSVNTQGESTIDTLGRKLSFDEWIKDGGVGTTSTPISVAVVSRERSMTGGVSQKKEKSDPSNASLTPLQQYLEGRLHAVRDGTMEDFAKDRSRTIQVDMYSFLQLMGGTALIDSAPENRVTVDREVRLHEIMDIVKRHSAPPGLSNKSYYENQHASCPSLYVYHDKTCQWQPLSQEIQLRLALLDSLANTKPLKLMYSLNFGDEIDEAFYYNKGKPTMEELESRSPPLGSPIQTATNTAPSTAGDLVQADHLSPYTKRPLLEISDSQDSDDDNLTKELIRSVSIPHQGLSPGDPDRGHTSGLVQRKEYARFVASANELGRATTNTGPRSQSVTTTDLNAKLRRNLTKSQNPPVPGYGVNQVAIHKSGQRKKGLIGVPAGLTGREGTDRALGAGSSSNPPPASLASLATTYIPPMKRSSTTSLLAGRGTALADHVGKDKQEEIARELQSRLLKTRWMFPN